MIRIESARRSYAYLMTMILLLPIHLLLLQKGSKYYKHQNADQDRFLIGAHVCLILK